MMGFTIKCNKCGTERVFTNKSSKYEGETISIDVYVRGTYMGDSVESIQIDCENTKCNRGIEIKC
jgi:hypothetical protein